MARVIICCFLALLSCRPKQIQLQKVNDLWLPEYFHNNLMFGTDMEAMTKKNDFIIATGVIDTTDEAKPIHVAFIMMNNQLTQLDLKYAGESNTIEREYSNGIIHLSLYYAVKKNSQNAIYFEGEALIKKQNQESTYKLFAFEGYR